MSRKKKPNPQKRQATQADVNKAKKRAMIDAINTVWAIFFTVMRDKEGYGRKRLCRLWGHVDELSDSIAKGYVSVEDLKKVLADEAGITLGE